MLTGARAYPVVLVSGVLLSLAFPEPDLAPIAWVALVPLLLALRAKSGERVTAGRGAALGFVFGLGFFATMLYWVSIVGYVAWAFLVVMESAFLALFGTCVALSGRGKRWIALLTPVTAWVAVEFARAHVPVVGFTWGQLAQSQHNLTWMLRPASLGGGWLVAGVVVGINVCLAEHFAHREFFKIAVRWLAPTAVLVLAPLLIPANNATGEALRVSIVQGNVPRNFSGSLFDKELAITQSHRELTEGLVDEHPDLVVWPESSVGLDIRRDPTAESEVEQAASAVGVPMIVGGNTDLDEARYQVVAFQVEPGRGVTDVYVKTHLVPFGEYVPGRGLLDWIPMLDQVPRDAVAGSEHNVFDIDGAKVATVLSFEGDFGDLVRKPIAGGGRLLVVATNTSTWGNTWASAQHEAFSQVRAAENGVWVVHAALSGISAFVQPDGTVVDETELWTATTMTHDVRLAESITLYARVGDWFPLLCIVMTVFALISSRPRRDRHQEGSGTR
ncbi:MAG: apolipoprotein N-acyltransferase [Actinomycetota bacterium]|nr:apolipoprotein N-acyltransferase [Actinomycetota bacterium]